MKPAVFIGSSAEALKVAYAIQENLEHDARCQVWTQDIFKLSTGTLDSLLDVLKRSDFAIFVFQPDDISVIRDRSQPTVRDNVVFEFGLLAHHHLVWNPARERG